MGLFKKNKKNEQIKPNKSPKKKSGFSFGRKKRSLPVEESPLESSMVNQPPQVDQSDFDSFGSSQDGYEISGDNSNEFNSNAFQESYSTNYEDTDFLETPTNRKAKAKKPNKKVLGIVAISLVVLILLAVAAVFMMQSPSKFGGEITDNVNENTTESNDENTGIVTVEENLSDESIDSNEIVEIDMENVSTETKEVANDQPTDNITEEVNKDISAADDVQTEVEEKLPNNSENEESNAAPEEKEEGSQPELKTESVNEKEMELEKTEGSSSSIPKGNISKEEFMNLTKIKIYRDK